MNPDHIQQAAVLLWGAWQDLRQIDFLPESIRPRTRAEGYAIQQAVAQIAGQATYGWKIAATSPAGQKHIGVDAPLAGRLLAGRVRAQSEPIAIGRCLMKVGEAEFAFRIGAHLPPREREYSQNEVMSAVAALHPAIEIPDSRFQDFPKAGAAQLIADNACAYDFVPGEATRIDWRAIDLAQHRVSVSVNGKGVQQGLGANALGDPRIALTWIANELRAHGPGLRADDVITTGTCVAPFTIAPGDEIIADFGALGRVGARIAA